MKMPKSIKWTHLVDIKSHMGEPTLTLKVICCVQLTINPLGLVFVCSRSVNIQALAFKLGHVYDSRPYKRQDVITYPYHNDVFS